ncbi:hypothetical protein GCM10022278_35900 [Allohahella marinimesophila]|uniref:Uracil DNA glycosylase superfamily protein n=2 Tax=Allohahella marinimesophila TaxID=1054972 RepID=A0ABP7Q6A7_9GAMM
MPQLETTHRELLDLQRAMLDDQHFKSLCLAHGLPWSPAEGYEPRWYGGPAPKDVELLFLMAELGPITPTEAKKLLPAINHDSFLRDRNLNLQEHYWRLNLKTLCSYVWPENTEQMMEKHLAGSCTFWMSLPHGSTTKSVPKPLIEYFSNTYLRELLRLFPNALILAAGGKARDRLRRLGVDYEHCWAFTRPGCNRREAHESRAAAGKALAPAMNHRSIRGEEGEWR